MKVYPDDVVKTDVHGLPYVVTDDGFELRAMYVSSCCNAAISCTADDGTVYCKACYDEVDPLLAGIPEPVKTLDASG